MNLLTSKKNEEGLCWISFFARLAEHNAPWKRRCATVFPLCAVQRAQDCFQGTGYLGIDFSNAISKIGQNTLHIQKPRGSL